MKTLYGVVVMYNKNDGTGIINSSNNERHNFNRFSFIDSNQVIYNGASVSYELNDENIVTNLIAGQISQKNRLTFILLAVFLGAFGVHNFYAKRNGPGIAQILISILSLGFLSPVSFMWAIIECIIIDKDGDNIPLL